MVSHASTHNNVSTKLSDRLLAFRKEHSWSQMELAKALDVSQGTISRLETSEGYLPEMRLLTAMAELLVCAVTDLVPKKAPPLAPAPPSPIFMAFCPNVLCKRNIPWRMPDGSVDINWKSSLTYPVVDFNKIVFCAFCKTKVVKACPSCGMAIGHGGALYCRRCGVEMFAKPTEKEWRKVKKRLDVLEMEVALEKRRRREERW